MKKVIYVLAADFLIILLNIVELVHGGFFRDAYADVELSKAITGFFWVSLFLSVGIFFVLLWSVAKTKQQKFRRAAKIVTGLFIVSMLTANGIAGVKYYLTVKNHQLNKAEKQDYISSEYFRGISLDELKKDINSDDEVMIYIGRETGRESKDFEKKFEKTLKRFSTEMSAYYTSKESDGESKEKIQDYLQSYNIEDVPCVIVAKKSQVIKMWKNPENKLDEIEKCL